MKKMVYTAQMVPLIMADLKTNSRRIMRPQPNGPLKKTRYTLDSPKAYWRDKSNKVYKPPHQPGDVVYVAEGYRISTSFVESFNKDYPDRAREITGTYSADNVRFIVNLSKSEWKKFKNRKKPWMKTSGRFMYGSLARTYLLIKDVKAERIQNISGEDAKAEGCTGCVLGPALSGAGCKDCQSWRPILWFKKLWNSIHGPGAWERDDWVYTYKFERCEKPEED